ncbi:MAG: hypothetical protein LLG45_08850 [Actinomycetia bacterium]|nr:hypothetical protein [Actinomycetes bacterium]
MGGEPALRVEPLCSGHDVETFDSGRPAERDYLRLHALADHGFHHARTFVALRDDRVVAYFTITAGSVEAASCSQDITRRRRRKLVPVVIIARLAVDATEGEEGVEEATLRQALYRSVAAAETIGARAVLAVRGGEGGSLFERYGFERLPACPFHVFLSSFDVWMNVGDESDTGVVV